MKKFLVIISLLLVLGLANNAYSLETIVVPVLVDAQANSNLNTTVGIGTQVLSANAGTLTGAISITCAAGVCTLSANFDTSQSSPDSMTLSYRFDSPDAALAITPL